MNIQTLQRVWHSFRLATILNSGKRAEYYRKHSIFRHIGKNCTIVDRKVPLYPKLISIGDNVHLASRVLLVTHDAIHICLNNYERSISENKHYNEKVGCIEIGDNVFIGSNSTVLYDVRIGSNVIIGAGSLVNKSIPDNSVAVGNPAHVVGSFDDYMSKRYHLDLYPDELSPSGHAISKELEDLCWSKQINRHSSKE